VYSIVFREIQHRAGAAWATRAIGFVGEKMMILGSEPKLTQLLRLPWSCSCCRYLFCDLTS
jgi:hypothetical protein